MYCYKPDVGGDKRILSAILTTILSLLQPILQSQLLICTSGEGPCRGESQNTSYTTFMSDMGWDMV